MNKCLDITIAHHRKRIEELYAKWEVTGNTTSKDRLLNATLQRLIGTHKTKLDRIEAQNDGMQLIDQFLEVQRFNDDQRIAVLGPDFPLERFD